MPGEVFVERELTASKGRKRSKLHLRVFAPVAHGAEFACSFELTTDGPRTRSVPKQIYGYDSLQAFALAMQMAAWHLLWFEAEHGMKIDAWQWSNIVDYVAEMPLSTYERDRIHEIKAELRELAREYREKDESSRKPRTARRKRS